MTFPPITVHGSIDGAELNRGVALGHPRVYSTIPAVVSPRGDLGNHHHLPDGSLGARVTLDDATYLLVHSLTVLPVVRASTSAEDDLDSPEARLDMVRAALRGIIDGVSDPVALARAGLDFCDLTAAERAEMRGDAEA